MLNRGLEPLLSPSPGMHSVLDPVEPPRLDNNLNALIAGYILSIKAVTTSITNPLLGELPYRLSFQKISTVCLLASTTPIFSFSAVSATP